MFNESYESLLKANLQIKMADKINSMGIINLESFWVDVFGVKDFEEFFKKALSIKKSPKPIGLFPSTPLEGSPL